MRVAAIEEMCVFYLIQGFKKVRQTAGRPEFAHASAFVIFRGLIYCASEDLAKWRMQQYNGSQPTVATNKRHLNGLVARIGRRECRLGDR